MLQLQRSPATTHNTRLKKVLRRRGQGNLAYVAAHASKRAGESELVLLGGTGPVDFRLRIAQAHARDDLLPSAWSHAAILCPAGKASSKRGAADRALYEISLSGKAAVGYPPSNNGVQRGSLADYDDPAQYPNIALLQVPIAFEKLERVIEGFRHQRTVMDALELQLTWWAFVWGVGRTPNPLFDQLGVPGAAFVEYVTSAAGYDLVPGFPSRSSCPESIWQASRWWHQHPRATSPEVSEEPSLLAAVSGVYDAEHYLVPPAAAKE